MSGARSAQAVTSLIRRLESPTPTREYEHKVRLLAAVRDRGSLDTEAGAAVIGHATVHTAGRLLVELVDEGLLTRDRGPGGGGHSRYRAVAT